MQTAHCVELEAIAGASRGGRVLHHCGKDRIGFRPGGLNPRRESISQPLSKRPEQCGSLDKAMNLAPAAFNMYVRNRVPWFRPEDHAHLLDGLRKAGWEG